MIPDSVMDQLKMPLACARFGVNSDDALGKEIVARSMTAVEVGGRRLDRQVNQSQFQVGRDLRPDAGIAVHVSRIVFPGVVTEFALFRNGVERPDQLSGLDVEGAGLTFSIVMSLNGHAL